MVLQKPPKWNDMNLNDKLRWYAKKDNDIKNIYADKYKIKFILKQMSLPGLHYAKTFTHVKPCLLYTSPSPRDGLLSRMPSSP